MFRPTKYNFLDVVWAPLRAVSAKRITLMTIFLLMALIVYNIFVYIALAVQGESLELIYSAFGFFFFSASVFTSSTAIVIYGAGCMLAVLAVMLGMFGVAAFEIEEIRGNRFLTIGQAIRFAFGRSLQIFLSELGVAFFLGFVALLFVFFGMLTRIPFIGEWLYAIFLVLPNFVVGFLVVITFVIMQISLLLLPAVAAADREGETFAAILETFSTVIRQPMRWIGYTVYALVTAKLGGFIYAYFCYRAMQFVTFTTALGGGEKIEKLTASGLSHLPYKSDLAASIFNVFPGFDFSFSLAPWARGGSSEAVGYLMAVMLFVIFASIIGYMLSVIACAQARGFVAIRYIKDGYSIADEKPLFFTEEYSNPPIDEAVIERNEGD